MSSLIKFFIIAIFASSLSLTAYAGPGNGNGQGHGQGLGHGHGYGQGHGYGHGYGHGKSMSASMKGPKWSRFSKTDKTTIHDYVNKNPIAAGALPPGIAMNLARGKPLPPGIGKQLPDDLVSKLPSRPGYEYLAAGDDIVLVNQKTQIISDVISNILK